MKKELEYGVVGLVSIVAGLTLGSTSNGTPMSFDRSSVFWFIYIVVVGLLLNPESGKGHRLRLSFYASGVFIIPFLVRVVVTGLAFISGSRITADSGTWIVPALVMGVTVVGCYIASSGSKSLWKLIIEHRNLSEKTVALTKSVLAAASAIVLVVNFFVKT